MTGTRLGMAFSVISFAALTGPPIGGAIQSADGGAFTGAQIFAGILASISFVFILSAKFLQGGWSLKVGL